MGVQVDLAIFHASPEPLDKNIVPLGARAVSVKWRLAQPKRASKCNLEAWVLMWAEFKNQEKRFKIKGQWWTRLGLNQ
jgi:hypothetical protein